MSAVVDFLEGRGVDGAGRTVHQVLGFHDAELERRHDFIQWLFPLTEPSAAVPGSPTLTPADVAALRSSASAQRSLIEGAARMLAFYRAVRHWRGVADHNHLRITRIIRSLRLLVSDAAADAFRAEILALAEGEPVSASSRSYWASA